MSLALFPPKARPVEGWFSVNGTTALMGIDSASKFSLYTIDTVTPGSPVGPLFQIDTPNNVARDAAFVYAFTSTSTATGQSHAIKKFSIADGTATTTIDFGSFGSVETIAVDETNVYWLERVDQVSGGPAPGTTSYRLAKQAK